MQTFIRCFSPGRRLLITCFLLAALQSSAIAASETGGIDSQPVNGPGTIVATIKPLFSLLAQLTDGVTEPVLLLEQLPSAHHHSLLPSQRRLIAKADMIIWIGPQMESYLEKILQQTNKTSVVSAMQAEGLRLLPKRGQHSHDHQSGTDDHASHQWNDNDPHIWLSTHNAIAISRHLAESLIKHDPVNRTVYLDNLNRLISRINDTAGSISAELDMDARGFIAYHDAYQYFDTEFGLNYIDAISFDEQSGTSLKHLREVRAQIQDQDIRCLVYQAPAPAIVSTLQQQTSIRTADLDPLGLTVKNSREAWFEIMLQLAQNFSLCLSPDAAENR
jgi:zinc transport system substrate-binding protein